MATAKIYLPTLHDIQAKVLQKSLPYRFVVFLCGRRFGKTVLIQYRISEAVLDGKKIYLFAPEFDSVIDTWENAITNYGAAARHIDRTMRIIHFHGGGEFHIIGLHSKAQRDKGRGKDADIVIYEETQSIESDILEYHWNNAMRPTLADRKGEAWFIGTPPNNKNHYFAKLYCKGALNNHNALGVDVPISQHTENEPQSPNYISFRKTAYDNPYIDNAELEEIRRDTPELVFEQEFKALFVEYTKRPFVLAFENKECEARVFSREIKPNPALPFYISFDFNLSAMAATIWQKDPQNNLIVCLAEFGCSPKEKVSIHYTTDLIRQWFLDEMKIRLGVWDNGEPIPPPSYLTIYITGDATGTQADPRQRSGRNFYQTIVRELGLEHRKGILKTPAANPHHSNSWGQINTWFALHQYIFISPKCARLRRDMKVTQVTEDKGIDKKAHDPHFFDTCRYFFNTFIPSKYDGQGKAILKNVE